MLKKLSAKTVSVSLAILLLAVQLLMQLHLARTDAQTTDEAIHLFAGYTYLTKGEFNYNAEHPPLIKTIAALPLLVIKPNMPDNDPYWEKAKNYFYYDPFEERGLAEQFLYKLGNNADQVLFWGRVPMTLLTLLLGVLVYAIAASFFGWWGGLLAVALYVFDPTVTAHGHLVTTDIGASIGYLLTIFVAWHLVKKPTWPRVLFFAVALSIALLSKFTTIILLPVLAVLFFFYARKQTSKVWPVLWPKLITAAGVIWFLILACYQFQLRIPPYVLSVKQAFTGQQQTVTDASFATKGYNALRYALAPGGYVKGLGLVITHVASGHDAYLLGQTSNKGWWYYFSIIFLAKTPLPSLLLAAIAIWWAMQNHKKHPVGGYLVLAAIGFLACASLSRANLGVRHILPVYPLLFIAIGSLVLIKENIIKRVVLGVSIAWLVTAFVRTYPYYLSSYNEVAGGAYNGYKIATDSNVEWGQDLNRIKAYIDQHHIVRPYLEYNWNGQPSLEYYGFDYRPLWEYKRGDSGTLILGASALQGKSYRWLKSYEPVDRITPSVFVYQF